MDFTGAFDYNLANLELYGQINIIIFLAVTIFFLISTIISRYVFLFIASLYMLYKENQQIKNRKKVLNDLILMKDIQSELEKEIEQATLQSAFQS